MMQCVRGFRSCFNFSHSMSAVRVIPDGDGGGGMAVGGSTRNLILRSRVEGQD